MELILVRHGLPERVELDNGKADPPLAPVGRQQADQAARWLANETINAVYSSPMQRAVETAEPFAALAGHDIRIHDGVAEYDREANSYVPMEELKAQDYEAWKAFVAGGYGANVDIPAFRATVVESLEQIITDHRGERVAVFCHAGVVNMWTTHVLDMAPRLFFEARYTSIHRYLCASSGERNLVSLNEVAHLATVGRADDF
jgi:probable phosphoglycerate mutase